MKKKIAPLLTLVTSLLFGSFLSIATISFNQNPTDLIESTVDEENERNNIKKLSLKYALNENEEASYSKIYVQYAYNDDENAHYLRYATAVKGNISSVSYIRKSVDGSIEEKEFECNTVYYGIAANGSTYYYDGTAPSLTEGAGEYYWATYAVKFKASSVNIAKLLDVSLCINGEIVDRRDDVSAFNQITSQYETINEEIKVMSFNIRAETTSDTGNKSWDTRKSHLMNWVLQEDADVICFQEVKVSQYNDLLNGLNSKYDIIYFARETGSTTSENPEGVAIAYNNTFELVEKDFFWLSATPNVLSKDWGTYVDASGATVDYEDDSYYRICGNALLRSNKGIYFDVYTVHLGLTKDSRKLGAQLIVDKMIDKGYPCVLMGDFNAQSNEESYAIMDSHFIDVQKEAVVSERDTLTFNGWAEPKSIIDYIFASEDIEPLTFDVNQETWNGNLYSDHYALDADINVSYTRENLNNIKSIEFNGDVKIKADKAMTTCEEEVVATYLDGSQKVLPSKYYTLDLEDSYKIGETPEKVVAKLNGSEDISCETIPVVENIMQAEHYDSLSNGKVNYRTLQENADECTTATTTVKAKKDIYGHLGGFKNNGGGTFTISYESNSNTVGDLGLRLANTYFVKYHKNTGYYVSEKLLLNRFMDIYVNNQKIAISDDVVIPRSACTTSSGSQLYHVLHNVYVPDVFLKQGTNAVKFVFKAHVDGLKNGLYPDNGALATSNVDYVSFVTRKVGVSSDETIASLETVNDDLYQVGDNILNTVAVRARLANGASKLLSSSEYTIELYNQDGSLAADQTKFVEGNYKLKITYAQDSSIVLEKNIEAVTYSISFKNVKLVQEGNKIFYVYEFNSVGYREGDTSIFHYNRVLPTIDTYNEETKVLTVKYDMTVYNDTIRINGFWPHLVYNTDGKWEMHNASNWGNLTGGKAQSITLNGYKYEITISSGMAVFNIAKV